MYFLQLASKQRRDILFSFEVVDRIITCFLISAQAFDLIDEVHYTDSYS